MPFFCGLRAFRPVTACVVLLALAGPAHAIGPESPDEGAIELDLAIQALKDEVVQLNRDAQLAEETHLYPPETRLSVYVSTTIPNLLLEQIQIAVDNEAPVTYRYQERDARALLAPDALQRLARLNVGRGGHQIRVQFSGALVTPKGEATPVVGSFDDVVDKGVAAAEIELQIVQARRGGDPTVRLKQWKAQE